MARNLDTIFGFAVRSGAVAGAGGVPQVAGGLEVFAVMGEGGVHSVQLGHCDTILVLKQRLAAAVGVSPGSFGLELHGVQQSDAMCLTCAGISHGTKFTIVPFWDLPDATAPSQRSLPASLPDSDDGRTTPCVHQSSLVDEDGITMPDFAVLRAAPQLHIAGRAVPGGAIQVPAAEAFAVGCLFKLWVYPLQGRMLELPVTTLTTTDEVFDRVVDACRLWPVAHSCYLMHHSRRLTRGITLQAAGITSEDVLRMATRGRGGRRDVPMVDPTAPRVRPQDEGLAVYDPDVGVAADEPQQERGWALPADDAIAIVSEDSDATTLVMGYVPNLDLPDDQLTLNDFWREVPHWQGVHYVYRDVAPTIEPRRRQLRIEDVWPQPVRMRFTTFLLRVTSTTGGDFVLDIHAGMLIEEVFDAALDRLGWFFSRDRLYLTYLGRRMDFNRTVGSYGLFEEPCAIFLMSQLRRVTSHSQFLSK